MSSAINILIAGVGGQGALTSATILARAAMKSGINVITAETHGMAQRGGSVEVHVRIGDVYSPLIPFGGADVLISLEPVEALRYGMYLHEKTKVILNKRPIKPTTVTVGSASYPELNEIVSKLKELTEEVYVVDASSVAERVASVQATNVVVIGTLAKIIDLPFGYAELEEAIRNILPEKIVDMNLKALKEGYNLIER